MLYSYSWFFIVLVFEVCLKDIGSFIGLWEKPRGFGFGFLFLGGVCEL